MRTNATDMAEGMKIKINSRDFRLRSGKMIALKRETQIDREAEHAKAVPTSS